MRALKPAIVGALLGAVPATAAAWDYGIERGLDLYQARDAEVSLALVCDPNNIYGATTQTGLLVNLGGNVEASIPATFRFPDGIAVKADLVHGRVGKAGTEAGAWAALVNGFRAYSEVIVEVGGQTRSVELGHPMMFTCA